MLFNGQFQIIGKLIAIIILRIMGRRNHDPTSALRDVVSIATAGVGRGPNRITSIPTEINPAVRAGSII